MAAPERFAEMSDSSCTAGAVHTWHFSDMARCHLLEVRFRGQSGSRTSGPTGQLLTDTVEKVARDYRRIMISFR